VARRRRRLVGVFFVLALLAGLPLAPRLSARLIARRLTEFFQRSTTVGEVRFHLFPLEAEVLSLRVAGPQPGAAPFLEVQRILAAPALGPVFGRRVVLSRLRVQGMRVQIHAYQDGTDDIPKTKPRAADEGGDEFRVRRLLVEGGELIVNHERIPLDLDLPDFQARLGQRRAGTLGGAVHFGPGRLRFGDAPPLSIGTDIELAADGMTLTAESGHLRTDGTDLAYTGRIRLAPRPEGQFELRGSVDLAVLEHHVLRTGFGLAGDARYEGSFSIDGSRLRLAGTLEGRGGVFNGVAIPRFGGEVSWDERGVRLRELDLATLGGQALLEVEVPPVGPARLKGQLREVDAEALMSAVFAVGRPGVAAVATGPIDLHWPRGRIRELSGTVAIDLVAGGDGRTPLSGRLDWKALDGVQTVESLELRTPGTRARLQGRIDRSDRTDLALDGESIDLAETDELLTRIRRAWGAADAQSAGFAGAGVFRGRWIGSLQAPVFEGRFVGQDVAYLGVVWGRTEWAGSVATGEVRSHSLVVRRPGAELWLDGRTETGDYGERDGLDLRLRLRDWPSADLATALEWKLDLRGPLTGEAQVQGRRSAPEGWAKVKSSAGTYAGAPYSALELSARLRPDAVEIREGRAHIAGGELSFKGTQSSDGVYDAAARVEDLRIEDLVHPGSADVAWAGRVNGEVTLQGPLERPRLAGRLTSPHLFLGDEGVGGLEAALSANGDGAVAVEARCQSNRVDLALSGRVGATPPYLSDLRLQAQATSLDPFLRPFAPDLPSGSLVATGGVHVEGPLSRPKDLELTASAANLEVLIPDHSLHNDGPVEMAVKAGRVQVSSLHLAGEGTDLRVEGSAAVADNGPLDLTLRGSADLRGLSAITGRLRGRGAAKVEIAIGGTRDAPRAEGKLDIDGGGLRARGFPHGIEDVRGTVTFSETSAQFASLKGTLGGGTVELGGQVGYAKGRLTSLDLQATGRGIALRYPEGLRSVVDADLKVFGDQSRQWVTGTVDVKEALWTRRYDVASELLGSTTARPESASLREGLQYDVTLRAPGTLKIDNNLATLQAGAELKLQGTYDVPVVLGRAEIDRGRVYFQGNTYVIRHGTIDFANPQRIDPLFDIEAETRLRSYRVTLKVSGTLERVYPTLTSDPPLSAVQILSLLAGADETAVASVDQAQQRQANLAATGAATLAAGRIAEEVGLERGAERLLGLNRFSIDPSVVRGTVTNPTARLTLGKRITPDLNVVYSQDLRGTEERLLSVEYTLSDRLSLLLTRADPEGFGFDLRLRHSR
jgi:translocation and assembly module TamB